MPHYYMYMLMCADNTLYAGATNDLERRLDQHNNSKRGAKYTRARRPVSLVHSETFGTLSEALKREAEIKGWKREEKLKLVLGKKTKKRASHSVRPLKYKGQETK